MKSRTAGKKKNSKILEEIAKNSYIGRIVEIDDPEKIGRAKITVFGVSGDGSGKLQQIPKEDLPWAYPLKFGSFGQNGQGSFSTPRMNAIVRVIFDGDQYHPFYYAIEDLDDSLKSKLKEAYLNFHSILFDEEQKLRIFYSTKSGLLLNLDDSFINILPDNSILITTKNNPSSIELNGGTITVRSNNAIDVSSNNTITQNSNLVHVNGVKTEIGASPIYSAMSGEPTFILLAALAAGLDAKLPVTSGTFASLVEQMKSVCLSKTVTTSP